MVQLPDFLASGQRARLFPVIADTSKEGRTLSVFLSCMGAVHELGRILMGSVNQRVGMRGKIETYTEVVFKNGPSPKKLRPDGLLVVTTGKRQWSALIEAKVGRNEIDADQVADYVQLAKANGINAVITISNQFAAMPDHHPVTLPKAQLKNIELYHWSWMTLVTQATLLLSRDNVDDVDQRFILGEFLRFLRHPSAGVASFDRMNPEWKDIVGKVQAGGKLTKTAPEVENTVASWHQEIQDLCLVMSRKLGRDIDARLPRAHAGDPIKRLRDDCDELVKSSRLECTLNVPDAAAPLVISADLLTRSIIISMKLSAPEDKRSTKARVNWLVRQLTKSDPQDIHIRALWPGRASATQASLSALREAPEALDASNKSMTPNSFEVLLVRSIASKFSGAKTFIEHLEEAVPAFYEQAGQHIRAWQPPAPKIPKDDPQDAVETGYPDSEPSKAPEREETPPDQVAA